MLDQNDRLRPVVVETRRGAEQLQRILETLARVELTDGLTFPQFAQEVASRMPRDATVVAILADVPPETAIALGNLRRSGFAVTAVLTLPNDDRTNEGAGRLMAEGVSIRSIGNEVEISSLCGERWVR